MRLVELLEKNICSVLKIGEEVLSKTRVDEDMTTLSG